MSEFLSVLVVIVFMFVLPLGLLADLIDRAIRGRGRGRF